MATEQDVLNGRYIPLTKNGRQNFSGVLVADVPIIGIAISSEQEFPTTATTAQRDVICHIELVICYLMENGRMVYLLAIFAILFCSACASVSCLYHI